MNTDQTIESIGQSVPRREDERFVTGGGQYVAALVTSGTLHVVFVRSTQASALIDSIDIQDAQEFPGVVAVLTGADFRGKLGSIAALHVPDPVFAEAFAFTSASVEVDCLALDRVHYVGEPVALVVAESRAVAEDASERVDVSYTPLPPVVTVEAALRIDAPPVHSSRDDNIAASLHASYGDVEKGRSRAAHTVNLDLRIGRHGAMPLETRGVVADWDSRAHRVNIWSSTQVPHMVAKAISNATGWSASEVRVATPDVGGGFGAKANVYPEEMLVPYVARLLNRRVAWIEDRAEHFQATAQGRDQHLQGSLSVDKRGKILAWDLNFVADVGAGSLWVAGIIANTALHALGPYRIPAYAVSGRAVFTNKTIVAQYRGAGRPEACFALERCLDTAAARVGVSGAEIRRRNILSSADLPHPVPLPYRDGMPIVYDGTDFGACLESAEEANSDLERKRVAHEYPELLVGGATVAYVEATGRGPYEGARVTLSADGRFEVSCGSASAGQSHETTFAQIACDALGADFETIIVRNGDTDLVPFGIGSFGSRSAVVGGSAVHDVCCRLRERASDLAAELLGIEREAIRSVPGGFESTGGRKITWLDVARELTPSGALGESAPLSVSGTWSPQTVTWTMGAHSALVGIDPETGQVRVLKYTVAHEGGREINPAVVLGQVQGGVAQGIGGALLETFNYGSDGQPNTASFAQYLVPSALDVPVVDVKHFAGRADLNPLGVKGVGESGTIPAYALLAAAVEDALEVPPGSILSTPIEAETVLNLMRKRD